jgi:hypothetical protein
MVSPYSGTVVKGITFILALLSGIAVFVGLCSKRIRIMAKLLCIGLIGLLPLGMNVIYVLSTGVVHDLMVFAVWLFYLFALLLTDWLVKQIMQGTPHTPSAHKLLPVTNWICSALVFVLMYGNVQTANALYLKKDQEQDAYLSMMTRVLYRMEDCSEYTPTTTPVVFVGISNQIKNVIPGFEEYQKITGAWGTDVLNSAERSRYKAYFDYILVNPIILVKEPAWNEWQTDARVREMPCYPQDGCIALIDDVLVVKLGNT